MRSASSSFLLVVLFIGLLTSTPVSVLAFQPTAMAMIAANKVIFSAVPVTTLPLLLTLAEAADDYEYGAVDAPIGIAWAGGILAILTATLPLFLKSGEKAFEEIKDRDADTFGKRNDILKKKK
jgi:hypothetical protein